ncbi:anthranilate phosphoribosyltransferase [Spongiactinospora sp. 9N601]|uniref:anthranilate phosphoribosyltransferase n=1 Tax=Spongiactinospora sp. 9N601 TaxID=3375149 RepID=UPI00379DC508
MSDLLATLVSGQAADDPGPWSELWDRVRRREAGQGELAGVVAVLSARPLDPGTARALVASLSGEPVSPPGTDAVNIVGTGGGPRTFNISTAAALVAAAAGVRVIKTGSRAYTSRHGSFDLLERLGVRLTRSPAETADLLGRHGIAFAGPYVYPEALRRLATALLPLDIRRIGRVFNLLGPLLASVPVAARLVGVADRSLVPVLRAAADPGTHGRVWLCHNEPGVDELLAFTTNTIDTGGERPRPPSAGTGGRLGLPLPDPPVLGGGDLADLTPVGDDADLTAHFVGLLDGSAPRPAVDTVALNAAALVLAAGRADGWPTALEAARGAIVTGRAAALLKELRS